MHLIQQTKPHCCGIKHGGEIMVSGFLDKIDLIAMERGKKMHFIQQPHHSGIKHGGEIVISGFLYIDKIQISLHK